MKDHDEDNFSTQEPDITTNDLDEDAMKKTMMDQNETLLKELEKAQAENAELKSAEVKVEPKKEESMQGMMIRRAQEIDKAPISSSMRKHAFSHKGALAVHGLDPNKHYRWVGKLDDKLKLPNAKNVGQRQQEGFVVTQDPESKLSGSRSGGGSTLETYDLILMETSKEKAVERAMQPVIAAKSRLTAVQTDARNLGLDGKIKGKKKTYENTLQMMEDTDSLIDVDSVL